MSEPTTVEDSPERTPPHHHYAPPGGGHTGAGNPCTSASDHCVFALDGGWIEPCPACAFCEGCGRRDGMHDIDCSLWVGNQGEPISDAGCGTCGGDEPGDCPGSMRSCGHHCNCVWVHDRCHWCPARVNDDGVFG